MAIIVVVGSSHPRLPLLTSNGLVDALHALDRLLELAFCLYLLLLLDALFRDLMHLDSLTDRCLPLLHLADYLHF